LLLTVLGREDATRTVRVGDRRRDENEALGVPPAGSTVQLLSPPR
jgi:hypothetical protein